MPKKKKYMVAVTLKIGAQREFMSTSEEDAEQQAREAHPETWLEHSTGEDFEVEWVEQVKREPSRSKKG